MTYHLRKAVTSEVKPLIGLYAESGCGKTFSSLLIAKGFTGDMSRVAMIETEAGRGEAFADDPVVGGYNILSIRGTFSPKEYGQAIGAAEAAKMECVIIDSASHEWEGVGGVLSMAADNQADGKKGVLVWQQPKIEHAREFVLRITQTPIPLVIVCMRAKYPMEEIEKIKDGQKKKEWIRSPFLSPKQSEDILFEMMIHAWIDQAHNLHPTKYTVDAMRQVFKEGEPVTVATGERLATWAKGKQASPPMILPASAGDRLTITAMQAADLDAACSEIGASVQSLKKAAGVEMLTDIKIADYSRALNWIDQAKLKRAAQ